MSFIDDQEKMVDFFTLSKEQFFQTYSYILEDEYEDTKREVIEKSGYWNATSIIEDNEVDGMVVGRIVQSIMMTEWLQNRGYRR